MGTRERGRHPEEIQRGGGSERERGRHREEEREGEGAPRGRGKESEGGRERGWERESETNGERGREGVTQRKRATGEGEMLVDSLPDSRQTAWVGGAAGEEEKYIIIIRGDGVCLFLASNTSKREDASSGRSTRRLVLFGRGEAEGICSTRSSISVFRVKEAV